MPGRVGMTRDTLSAVVVLLALLGTLVIAGQGAIR